MGAQLPKSEGALEDPWIPPPPQSRGHQAPRVPHCTHLIPSSWAPLPASWLKSISQLVSLSQLYSSLHAVSYRIFPKPLQAPCSLHNRPDFYQVCLYLAPVPQHLPHTSARPNHTTLPHVPAVPHLFCAHKPPSAWMPFAAPLTQSKSLSRLWPSKPARRVWRVQVEARPSQDSAKEAGVYVVWGQSGMETKWRVLHSKPASSDWALVRLPSPASLRPL